MDGFVCVDKPPGPTSFDVIRRVRQLTGERRAGHTGTLDPAATGLLVIALGKATRLLPLLPVEPKAYQFGIRFGAETDTLDAAGTVVREGGAIPRRDGVAGILSRFAGAVQQEPPRYSAVKVKGERAYDRARRDEDFGLPARTIRIQSLTLDSYDETRGEAACSVVCSSGTYVRSLARDIALALGTLGYASRVRRTRIGAFAVDRALQWGDLAASLPAAIVPVREAFSGFTWVTLSPGQQASVRHGMRVSLNVAGVSGPVFASTGSGELAAVLEQAGPGEYQPTRVFV